jgi:hypothetical protein
MWPHARLLSHLLARAIPPRRDQKSRSHQGCPFLGDLDGDGNLDALVTNFGHPNEIWLGDGAGGFSDSGLHLSGDANNSGAALGDLDDDGDLDIFLANFVGGANEIWFNETD